MRFGSLFTGVGGFDLGLERAGYSCAWQAEVEPNCVRVLKRHWPAVKNHGDVRAMRGADLEPVELIAAGFPCQGASVAGKRLGLADDRTALFYEMVRLVDELRPLWLVWENVPGLFSVAGGRDFLAVVRALDAIGYGGGWTVLDARYFGLAQRRRRIFGAFTREHPRAERAAEVLALGARLRGYPPPRRASRPGVAPALGSLSSRRGWNDDLERAGAFVASDGGADVTDAQAGHIVASTLRAADGHHGRSSPRGDGCDNLVGTADGAHTPTLAWALQERGRKGPDSSTKDGHLIAFDTTQITSGENRCNPQPGDPCHPLAAAGHAPTIAFADVADPVAANQGRTYTREGSNNFRVSNVATSSAGVRRLTPRECERLQGFPDDWTRYGARDEEIADTHRYAMCGNAVPPPIVAWLGQRILNVEGR